MSVNPVLHCPDPERWLEIIKARTIASPGGCLIWVGSLDHSGYGRFSIWVDGVRIQTGGHRAAWLAMRGDIEPGLQIDHLCRVRRCVNVMHLEPVTPSVNVRRSHLKGRKQRVRKSWSEITCSIHGREDGYPFINNKGHRLWACRICRRAAMQRYKQRQAMKLAG